MSRRAPVDAVAAVGWLIMCEIHQPQRSAVCETTSALLCFYHTIELLQQFGCRTITVWNCSHLAKLACRLDSSWAWKRDTIMKFVSDLLSSVICCSCIWGDGLWCHWGWTLPSVFSVTCRKHELRETFLGDFPWFLRIYALREQDSRAWMRECSQENLVKDLFILVALIREMQPNTHLGVLCDFLFTTWSTLKSSKYLECLQLTQKNTRIFGSSGDDWVWQCFQRHSQSIATEGGRCWLTGDQHLFLSISEIVVRNCSLSRVEVV